MVLLFLFVPFCCQRTRFEKSDRTQQVCEHNGSRIRLEVSARVRFDSLSIKRKNKRNMKSHTYTWPHIVRDHYMQVIRIFPSRMPCRRKPIYTVTPCIGRQCDNMKKILFRTNERPNHKNNQRQNSKKFKTHVQISSSAVSVV